MASRSTLGSAALMFICSLGYIAAAPAPAETLAIDKDKNPALKAGDANAGRIEDIVVTAQRREERLQRVPIAITAFSAADIKRNRIERVGDIAEFAPNLEIKSVYGSSRPSIFLRGIGFDSFNAIDGNSVSVIQDDVVIEARAAQLSQLFDTQRIEVLRGPQGTLFGRNTTGGAVSFYSVLPDFKPSGFARVSYGNYNALELEGAETFPLSDKLTVRISGTSNNSDGYIYNQATHTHDENDNRFALRGIALYRPTDNMEWVLNVNGSHSNTRGGYYFEEGTQPGNTDFLGYSNPRDFYTLSNNTHTFEHVDTNAASLRGKFDFDFGTLTSVTAYNFVNEKVHEDSDASPSSLFDTQTGDYSQQVSQEFRLSGGDERLKWVVGAFLFDQRIRGYNFFNAGFSLLGILNDTDLQKYVQHAQSYAAFGQVDYKVLPKLTATFGLRMTYDTKNYTQSNIDPNSEIGSTFEVPLTTRTNVTPTGRFGLEYQVNKGLLTYASYNRGYRSGQPSGFATFSTDEFTFTNPEYVNAYEVGVKADFLDGHLRTNLAGFYNSFNDLQVNNFVPHGNLNLLQLLNAAGARTFGLEEEVTARPLAGLTFGLNGSWLDARYTAFSLADANGRSVNLAGQNLVSAPEWSFTALAEYAFKVGPGTLTSSITYDFRTSQLLLLATDDAFVRSDGTQIPFREPAYGLLNASFTYEPEHQPWSIRIWGRNIADARYRQDIIDVSGIGLFEEKRGRPPTYGAELRVTF